MFLVEKHTRDKKYAHSNLRKLVDFLIANLMICQSQKDSDQKAELPSF